MYPPLARIQVIPPKQREDIAASEGPHTIWRNCFRIKQYIKPHYRKSFLSSPRAWAFDQPFQIAAERCGMDWNRANRVFLGQVDGCNLKCPYCYLDTSEPVETVPYTGEEYVWEFIRYNEANPHAQAGVLRVSGGEPMLHQAWVKSVIEMFGRSAWNYFLWIDTNGTIPIRSDILELLSEYGHAAAVCLCLKPGVRGVELVDQMRIVQELVEARVETFIYYPAWDGEPPNSDAKLEAALDGLYAIHPHLPLRTTIIGIHLYGTNRERMSALMVEDVGEPSARLRDLFMCRRWAWEGWCEDKYADQPDLLWLPSHQLRLWE